MRSHSAKLPKLTLREIEILRLIADEHSSTSIAAHLGISIRTVETHRKNLARKTGVKTAVGLLKFGIQAGIIEGYKFIGHAIRVVSQTA